MSGAARASWLLSALITTACARPQPPLQVPETLLALAERYDVSGHVGLLRHTVQFGPYTARETQVGVQHPSLQKPTLFNGQTERAENHQAGSFELLGPDGTSYRGECQKHRRKVTKHDQTVALDETGKPRADGHVVSASSTYRCTLLRPSGAPLQLFIVEGSSGLVQGEGVELSFLQVRPEGNQVAPTWKESAGFLLADSARELAAVDLTEAPAVILRKDLPAQQTDELAAVCMALLLLRDMF
ncbi:MAG: hypothetical protein JWN48_114 [Myxococcaceae bacterium]|nr:hypothetical protein [Myxococcaceae bacterium]